MKVVILAGGFGTRISEYTTRIPKPMVEIGDRPILWHIMNWYAKFGYNDFVIALGYKAPVVKEYFLNYYALNNDFTVDLAKGDIEYVNKKPRDWKVTLVDTGLNTMTGGRIKRLQEVIGDNQFMVTYGDGLSNVNIDSLVKFHNESGKVATLSAVHPTARFGELDIDDTSTVKSFKEKPQLETGRINGGFFVFNPEIFDFIEGDDTILERAPMEKLVASDNLTAYKHDGFWQSMDTVREREILEEYWNSGNAPWK
ncbi:MAG: glucose-1-phosphate cytidylyltransferase [Marinifilaceae bacterium]|jgi:glucose-1-phosphate cytidylyltransferase|nr:glucose-1-phosphate cytidylyltransferase [Marinifilaceae bacterium]